MSREYTRWTFVEITRLRKMLEEGKSREHIASILGMSVQRVSERIKQENTSPEQKRAKYERAKALREKNKTEKPRRLVSHPRYDAVLPHGRPTAEMLEKAHLRSIAPRSLSATLLGDPPVGYSALDQRQGA
jgi:hypothetical protein